MTRKDLRRIRLDHLKRRQAAADALFADAMQVVDRSERRIELKSKEVDEKEAIARQQLAELKARLDRGIDEAGKPLTPKQHQEGREACRNADKLLRKIDQAKEENRRKRERVRLMRSRAIATQQEKQRHLADLEQYQQDRENARDWRHPKGFLNLVLNALLVFIIGRKIS